MHRTLDLLHRTQKKLYGWLRLRTRGVKVMLFSDQGQLMLIRNSYGRTDLFVLPGGGVRPFESPEAAARREVREELGVQVRRLKLRSTHFSDAEGKRDTIHLFEGIAAGVPNTDSLEIDEVRFFSLGALPDNISAATLRRIQEYRGERRPDGRW